VLLAAGVDDEVAVCRYRYRGGRAHNSVVGGGGA
jgi:hypothetical protein